MYDEYEESFYYDRKESTNTEVAGSAIGLGLELGGSLIEATISIVFFLIFRMDILGSCLVSLTFYMLTYKYEWDKTYYIVAAAGLFIISLLLQHYVKVFRVIYGIFTCGFIAMFGTVVVGYDTQVEMYKTFGIFLGVTALLEYISWCCISGKSDT